jgi:crossover junction endodeoxyribonuclease RuvC
MIIGIDPGLTGAIAFMYDSGVLMAVEDMPIMPNGKGKGRVKSKVNCYELSNIIGNLLVPWDKGRVTAYLEKVSSMPGQGVAGVFSLGKSAGAVEGVLAGLGIPLVEVTPQAWKKGAGLIGTEKDVARTMAQQLYPDASLARKKDIGRADALMIARHGWLIESRGIA